MGEGKTPAQSGSENKGTSTQGQVTGSNVVTNQSGHQKQSTSSARGDRLRRNHIIVLDTQCKDFDGVSQ